MPLYPLNGFFTEELVVAVIMMSEASTKCLALAKIRYVPCRCSAKECLAHQGSSRSPLGRASSQSIATGSTTGLAELTGDLAAVGSS